MGILWKPVNSMRTLRNPYGYSKVLYGIFMETLWGNPWKLYGDPVGEIHGNFMEMGTGIR